MQLLVSWRIHGVFPVLQCQFGQMQMEKTGLVYDDAYLDHKAAFWFPEKPARLTRILDRLRADGLLERLVEISPIAAAPELIETVHERKYIDHIREACESGKTHLDKLRLVPICRKSYDTALIAAGGVIAGVDAVMNNEVSNAFCAVRPPGHHALPDRAMGFCIMNNVAVAARYLQDAWDLQKILIIDWDVHHGNGTQAAFYDDPTVLYFSTHQWPFYPGTGGEGETGQGPGEGYTINVPMHVISGNEDYEKVYEEKLIPAAVAFDPDFILISAGFDAHIYDLLSLMKLTDAGFAKLTRIVKNLADKTCQGRLVSVLEGGYHLESLAASVAAHIRSLTE